MSAQYDSADYLNKVNAWWRTANYISVAQMYLKDNPLLMRPIQASDVKTHPIGHRGTVAGQNFIYAHLNRAINKYDLNMFYIEGPGRGGQMMMSNSYLDGSYSEIYPNITQDEAGLKQLCKIFSFPGGIASHTAPEAPGSIHEGDELGYALSHAVGAVLDSPDVIATTVISDGKAEAGPLSAGWFSNAFINPVNDGAVLPILYLNGGKTHNPTILACKSDESLRLYFEGSGWGLISVEATDYATTHKVMAQKLDGAIKKIKAIQTKACAGRAEEAVMPKWPVLAARLPKGQTGPKVRNGEPIGGGFRAHQVSIPASLHDMATVDSLVEWLKSYRPEGLFNANGTFKAELREVSPKGDHRTSTNPIINGDINPRLLSTADWKKFALDNSDRGSIMAQDMIEFDKYAAGLVKTNPDNFRIFGPDETKSNRMNEVFKVTNRQWLGPIDKAYDEWMSLAGHMIDSQLPEHQAEGFLEGYVLTGRHGLFASYKSFPRVVDSMATQHFKWLRKCKTHAPWRESYPLLNLIATSTVFQQDRNGYTHQDQGMLTYLAEKRPEFVREYLSADANSLLAVVSEVLSSKDKVNLIMSSKHPRLQFYSAAEAEGLVHEGYKVIDWASTDKGGEPDVVITATVTEPNLEALAAITILNKQLPEPKIRFINVVDILKLRHPKVDPHGLIDEQLDALFTKDKLVIFCFHGYGGMVCDIFLDHHNHNLCIHGYRENGDITTPFDMCVLSEMDCFYVTKDAALAVCGDKAQDFAKKMDDTLAFHHSYIRENGEDIPEVRNWKWETLK